MATLAVDGLHRAYPGKDAFALGDVSSSVPDGHVAALIGPAGAGKTALLRLIAGLDRADAGAVLLNGVAVTKLPPHRRGVGLVF